VKCISYEALHYVVFSSLLLLPPLALCSQTPSIYDPSIVLETKFHTRTNHVIYFISKIHSRKTSWFMSSHDADCYDAGHAPPVWWHGRFDGTKKFGRKYECVSKSFQTESI